MSECSPEVEAMAKKIAFWHGQKMVYHDRNGNQTVASSRGFGHWGDSSDRYMHAHWHEYTAAAREILKEIDHLKAQIDGMQDALHYVE